MTSERVERICVIRYDESREGFSAKERSDMNSRGMISLTLRAERIW